MKSFFLNVVTDIVFNNDFEQSKMVLCTLYVFVNCLSDARVAPSTSLSSYCFGMRKNTAVHSFLSARIFVYSESISRILYWFSFVESIESLCTVCVVETDRKIFNSAKNLVIVCGGVFCGDTGWWKFFWFLWRKIKPQRKKQSIKHHRY